MLSITDFKQNLFNNEKIYSSIDKNVSDFCSIIDKDLKNVKDSRGKISFIYENECLATI